MWGSPIVARLLTWPARVPHSFICILIHVQGLVLCLCGLAAPYHQPGHYSEEASSPAAIAIVYRTVQEVTDLSRGSILAVWQC